MCVLVKNVNVCACECESMCMCVCVYVFVRDVTEPVDCGGFSKDEELVLWTAVQEENWR
jgi:hypothetical protein